MNKLILFITLLLLTSVSAALTVPGTPGVDYPNYTELPDTSFDCKKQQYPGYYADPETRNQAFYICQADGRQNGYLCPVGTVFDQTYFVCNLWNEVNPQ